MFKENTGAPTRNLDHKDFFAYRHPKEWGRGEMGGEGKGREGDSAERGGERVGKEWRRDGGGRGEVRWENRPRITSICGRHPGKHGCRGRVPESLSGQLVSVSPELWN